LASQEELARIVVNPHAAYVWEDGNFDKDLDNNGDTPDVRDEHHTLLESLRTAQREEVAR
jgi:hypothetical protein